MKLLFIQCTSVTMCKLCLRLYRHLICHLLQLDLKFQITLTHLEMLTS